MKGRQGIAGKVSVVEGSYLNDFVDDEYFSLNDGTD